MLPEPKRAWAPAAGRGLGQAGSYEDVAQALVLHDEPQPSLVLHLVWTSGVVSSTTRMSRTKSSSVIAAAGGSRVALCDVINITPYSERGLCRLAGES